MRPKTLNTFFSVLSANLELLRGVARTAWENSGRAHGAFLNRIYADPQSGIVYYDTMDKRCLLEGYRIVKRFSPRKVAYKWELEHASLF